MAAARAVHSGLMYRAAESVSDATKAMKQGSRASPENTARQALAQKDFAFVPVMVIHGSKDDTVNPVNADQVVEQFMAMSRLADGGNKALTEFTRSESGGDRYPYEMRDYRRGDMLLLRKVLVEGLDHAWSGARPGESSGLGSNPRLAESKKLPATFGKRAEDEGKSPGPPSQERSGYGLSAR